MTKLEKSEKLKNCWTLIFYSNKTVSEYLRNSDKFKHWFFSLLISWFLNWIVSEWYTIGSKCCWIVEWQNWRKSKNFKPWFFFLVELLISQLDSIWMIYDRVKMLLNHWMAKLEKLEKLKKFKPWFFSLLICWFPNWIVSEWYRIGSKCCWIVEWQNWRNWRNLKKFLALTFFPIELLTSQFDNLWMIYDRVKMLLNRWMAKLEKLEKLKKFLTLIFFPVDLLISQLDSIWMI